MEQKPLCQIKKHDLFLAGIVWKISGIARKLNLIYFYRSWNVTCNTRPLNLSSDILSYIKHCFLRFLIEFSGTESIATAAQCPVPDGRCVRNNGKMTIDSVRPKAVPKRILPHSHVVRHKLDAEYPGMTVEGTVLLWFWYKLSGHYIEINFIEACNKLIFKIFLLLYSSLFCTISLYMHYISRFPCFFMNLVFHCHQKNTINRTLLVPIQLRSLFYPLSKEHLILVTVMYYILGMEAADSFQTLVYTNLSNYRLTVLESCGGFFCLAYLYAN